MKLIQEIYSRFSIIDIINFIILIVIFIIYLFTFEKTPWRLTLLVVYIVLCLYLLVMSRLRITKMKKEHKALLMFVNPVIFLFSIFESFYMLLPYFNSTRYDALLDKIDFIILGVSPTLWIEKFTMPVLTDILYLFYFFYFPMPLIILGWMLFKRKYNEIEKAMFILLFCYYGAYIIYFLIPAQGPRFFLQDSYSIALNGYFLAGPIHALIDTLEPNKLDAFPSLHTAILTVTMIVTYRYNRKMFGWFIPAAIGIVVSLIYCRYHYFIDMLAGLLWAVIATILADRLYKNSSSYFIHHFGKQH